MRYLEKKKKCTIFPYRKTWSYFVETFTKLWIGEGVEAYTKEKQWLPIILQNIFTDAVGFAGCELIRRTIGLGSCSRFR